MGEPHQGQQVRERLQGVAQVVQGLLPEGSLFSVLVWTSDAVEGLGAHYVSNAERSDVIRNLRETADRLEGRPAPPSMN